MLEIERRNQELWLQGLYIHEAFATVVSNIFAKKGTTPKKYRETPIRITPLTEQEKKLEEQKARQQLIAKLNAIEARWNKNNKAEGSD